jgi:hypothetical protein
MSAQGGAARWWRRARHAGGILWDAFTVLLGVGFTIAGIYLAADLGPSHAFCNSGAGVLAPQKDCTAANAAYYGGFAAIVIGILLVAVTFWARSRDERGNNAKPGWHEMPSRPGWVAYWDGNQWISGTERPPPGAT